MGYQYYCLLSLGTAESQMTPAEFATLKAAYIRLRDAGGFPKLGEIESSGSEGLGCGITYWGRNGLCELSRAAPGRRLVLWCVCYDFRQIWRCVARDAQTLDEGVVVGARDPSVDGPFGTKLIPTYPPPGLSVPHGLNRIEDSYDGSGDDECE